MKEFDVLVIGAGPGGYVAAIRCAQLGLATACVDGWLDDKGKATLGGTCLNVGCIPSKALLDSSHHFHNIAHLFPAHGIKIDGASIDVPAMQARKRKVVHTLTRGVAGLFKKNKVTSIPGQAALAGDGKVEIMRTNSGVHSGADFGADSGADSGAEFGADSGADSAEKELVSARHIIIASGSVPIQIPSAVVDDKLIVDNVGALEFDSVPARLGVIGAGVIGLELGSVWNRLGSEVVILEALDDFLPAADPQIAEASLKILSRQGLDIRLGSRVTHAAASNSSVSVEYSNAQDEHALEVDRLVVAVGRRPNIEGLNLESVGVDTDGSGRVVVDELCRTSRDRIYAIGDVVRGPMLAHKASEEGISVAEQIAGQHASIDHAIVPWVIYTHPEIAWVGKTETELEAEGIAWRSGTFPYLAIGRAQGAGETTGLVKIIGDARDDRLLGVHIFGAQASELIAEAVTAMAFHASTEDLARIIHAHPTLSEAVHEAALALDARAIHM